MSGTLSAQDIVVFVGNSITAGTPTPWQTTALATINGNFATTTRTLTGSNSGRQATATGRVGSNASLTFTPAITTVNSGVGGNKAADIAAAVTSRVLAYNPTAVVVEIGINDASGGTSPSSYRTSVDSIFDQIIAGGVPAAKIWCIEVFLYGEAWAAGPVWNNAFDPQIDALNVQLAASAAARGINYAPTRAAALALSVINNPTGLLNNGVLMQATGGPGPHPNTALGQPCMASQWLTTVTVTPYP